MARFSHPLPFSPLYDFMACKPVTINGAAYQPGDRMSTEARDGLGERRLRQMYESRLITPIPPEPVPALLQAAAEPASEPLPDYAWSDAGGGGGDGGFDPMATEAAPAVTAVHKGFGRWFIVRPDGTEEGPMTKAEADAIVGV
jgi:hypothetical protein